MNEQGRKKGGRRSRGKITSRGRRFAEGVVRGLSQYAAAKAAGYSDSIANHPRRLWRQASILSHFQKIVQHVLPPERAARLFDALLEGKTSSTAVKRERMAGPDGTVNLQVTGATTTEVIDRSVQLRALQLAAEHGGLVPSSVRARAISSASLDEVLARAEAEHIKFGARRMPTWVAEKLAKSAAE